MKIREYIQVRPAGSDPDPATYCPTEGYYDPDDPDSPVIWNPINPADGWFLIASFQTNSPNSTTFDPSISASSGDYAWDLGDGTFAIGDKAISHTYLTTATRTVKLYGKGTCNIYSIDFTYDNIVGVLDISNSAFSTLSTVYVNNNLLMTSVLLPSVITATITYFAAFTTGITGVLDLSAITNINAASIFINGNASMTGVSFASSITGTLGSVNIYSTGITGILDFSAFANFTASAYIGIYQNPSMTGIIFASSVTGTINEIRLNSCNITGILDLSKFITFTNTATISIYGNALMTGVSFTPSTITGIVRTLYVMSTGITGVIDVSKLTTGVASLNWRFDGNGWSAAVVNQMLVNLDAMSASGFTSRVINIGGSNADPDTTSGGYNGSAAKTSLEGKSFTVTIT